MYMGSYMSREGSICLVLCMYVGVCMHSVCICVCTVQRWTYIQTMNKHRDPNGSCLFAAGSPTVTVGSKHIRAFSSSQIAFCWLTGRCRQCCSDFLRQCAGDVEPDHIDSGIVMECADETAKHLILAIDDAS